MDFRKLDAIVAEKIMGYESIKLEPVEFPEVGIELFLMGKPPGEERRRQVPNYSTSVSCAWEVIDKLRANLKMTREHLDKITIELRFVCWDGSMGSIVSDTGKSMMHAVCLCALKCKGIEVSEFEV